VRNFDKREFFVAAFEKLRDAGADGDDYLVRGDGRVELDELAPVRSRKVVAALTFPAWPSAHEIDTVERVLDDFHADKSREPASGETGKSPSAVTIGSLTRGLPYQ
jgi:hypothetical protein